MTDRKQIDASRLLQRQTPARDSLGFCVATSVVCALRVACMLTGDFRVRKQKHPRFGRTPVIIFCMCIATCHRTYVAGNRAAGQQFVEHSCTAAEVQ
jgi:hypothetical protein